VYELSKELSSSIYNSESFRFKFILEKLVSHFLLLNNISNKSIKLWHDNSSIAS
jgi:hypothetical protein